MERKNVTYGQPLEKEIGFSRAVRIGNIIAVSGTAPIAEDGSVAGPGDVYEQTKRCLSIIKNVIEQAGGQLEDVVRTRLFLTKMSTWKDAAKCHGEFFPACSPRPRLRKFPALSIRSG